MFLLVLLFNAIIRFQRLDYPILNPEALRDYLVARHIAIYHEFLLTGPCCLWNGLFGLVRNSPVYYYLLAFFVVIRDDIIFLTAVNIVLQLFVLTAIYFLAKRLFSPTTGLLAALFFGLTSEVLSQSAYIWQPYLMQPILWASYLAFFGWWKRYNPWLLVTSVILFFLAAAVHNAVYALLPSFIFLLWYRTRNIRDWLLIVLAASLALFFFYGPWLVFLLSQKTALNTINQVVSTIAVGSLGEYGKNVVSAITVFFNLFFQFKPLLALVISGAWIWYLMTKPQKQAFLAITLAIGQFILVAGLFKATVWPFYFIPVMGLFVMGVAEIVAALPARAIVIVLIVFIFSQNSFLEKRRQPLVINQVIGQATQAIINEERGQNDNLFGISVYAPFSESPVNADLILWVPVEKALKKKILRVVDAGHSYELPSEKDYVFVACQQSPCLDSFSAQHPGYQVVKQVFSQDPFTIYLARKN